MADVFISYSRDDRARVEPIARAFEAEGYSVWWDPDIKPGETWDEVIERELHAAACVIVAWSKTSVQSKWVRSEASEADDRRVLVPVRLDDTRVPLAFKLIQVEDFIAWRGDRDADCWQRVMLQAVALAGERGASPLPSREGVGRGKRAVGSSLGVTGPKSPHPYPLPIRGGGPVGGEAKSRSTTLLTLSAVLILAAAWWLGAADRSPVITTTVILAALAFVLFRLAEDDLSPGMKAIARRWMMPVEGKVQVSAIEAFNGMFEAVFGRRHFSWFCFWRSVLTSFLFFVVMLAAVDYLVYDFSLFRELRRPEHSLVEIVLVLIVVPFFWNIAGNYFSLLETRFLLRLASVYPAMIFPIVILDAVLSMVISWHFLRREFS